MIVWAALIAGLRPDHELLLQAAHRHPARHPGIPVLIMIVVVIVMTFGRRAGDQVRPLCLRHGRQSRRPPSCRASTSSRTTMMIFVIIGVLCAIAAVITSARLNAGANSMGNWQELNVIAAAGDRRHVAGRRHRHRSRRDSGGGDHAEPGERHGAAGRVQRGAR